HDALPIWVGSEPTRNKLAVLSACSRLIAGCRAVGTGSAPAAGRAGKDVMGPHPIGSAPVGPRAGGLSRTELQLGQELPDVVIDVVADPARLLDGGVGRVIQGPVLIPLAGVDRAGVPATHGDDDV